MLSLLEWTTAQSCIGANGILSARCTFRQSWVAFDQQRRQLSPTTATQAIASLSDAFGGSTRMFWFVCAIRFSFRWVNFAFWFQVDNCLIENIARNLTTQQDRVNFYTNITSCILARSRCNAYNPITGELQSGNKIASFHSQSGVLSNALQITTTGDLRVVSFSQKVGVSNLFCSTQATLDQAGYGVTTCWKWNVPAAS